MASLTPLSKGLIGLAVIGAMASAVWNLALKERFASPGAAPTTTTLPTVAPASTDTPAAIVTPPLATQPTSPVAPAVSGSADGLSVAEHAEKGRQLMEASDFAQARGHLEQAVKGGDAGAACLLGEMTLKGQGGITADHEAAAKLFQLAQSRNTICFAAGQ